MSETSTGKTGQVPITCLRGRNGESDDFCRIGLAGNLFLELLSGFTTPAASSGYRPAFDPRIELEFARTNLRRGCDRGRPVTDSECGYRFAWADIQLNTPNHGLFMSMDEVLKLVEAVADMLREFFDGRGMRRGRAPQKPKSTFRVRDGNRKRRDRFFVA